LGGRRVGGAGFLQLTGLLVPVRLVRQVPPVANTPKIATYDGMKEGLKTPIVFKMSHRVSTKELNGFPDSCGRNVHLRCTCRATCERFKRLVAFSKVQCSLNRRPSSRQYSSTFVRR